MTWWPNEEGANVVSAGKLQGFKETSCLKGLPNLSSPACIWKKKCFTAESKVQAFKLLKIKSKSLIALYLVNKFIYAFWYGCKPCPRAAELDFFVNQNFKLC